MEEGGGRGGKKGVDSYKRKKLVTTSISRVTQGVDYLIEEDATITTKGASGCQRFDSKRHSKGQ